MLVDSAINTESTSESIEIFAEALCVTSSLQFISHHIWQWPGSCHSLTDHSIRSLNQCDQNTRHTSCMRNLLVLLVISCREFLKSICKNGMIEILFFLQERI